MNAPVKLRVAPVGYHSHIEINGEPLKGAMKFTLESAYDTASRLTIECRTTGLEGEAATIEGYFIGTDALTEESIEAARDWLYGRLKGQH